MSRKHHLIQLGYGNVGSALVAQIQSAKPGLIARNGIDFVYCGLFTSKLGMYDPSGLTDVQVATFPSADNTKASEAIENIPLPFTVIDATSSDATLPLLKRALSRGATIVLANKRPLAGSQADFDDLVKIGSGRIYYEATVGAGLPIIRTLQDLLATGDEITSIKGCFSGTLGYILSQLDAAHSYSGTVRQALRLGYTEADPREDLSGMDVARKAIILSRLIGRRLEPIDLEPEALYPTRFEGLSVSDFMDRLPEMDLGISDRLAKAQKRGFSVRYVAQVTAGATSVGLQEVNSNSDIGALAGPDNIVIIRSSRYAKNPIIIKGPGAGPDVTAAGVFANIIEAATIRDDAPTAMGVSL